MRSRLLPRVLHVRALFLKQITAAWSAAPGSSRPGVLGSWMLNAWPSPAPPPPHDAPLNLLGSAHVQPAGLGCCVTLNGGTACPYLPAPPLTPCHQRFSSLWEATEASVVTLRGASAAPLLELVLRRGHLTHPAADPNYLKPRAASSLRRASAPCTPGLQAFTGKCLLST